MSLPEISLHFQRLSETPRCSTRHARDMGDYRTRANDHEALSNQCEHLEVSRRAATRLAEMARDGRDALAGVANRTVRDEPRATAQPRFASAFLFADGEANSEARSVSNNPPARRVVWGAKGIGAAINRSERSTFHLLEKGEVPGAKKIAGRWCLDVEVFFASFNKPAAPSAPPTIASPPS